VAGARLGGGRIGGGRGRRAGDLVLGASEELFGFRHDAFGRILDSRCVRLEQAGLSRSRPRAADEFAAGVSRRRSRSARGTGIEPWGDAISGARSSPDTGSDGPLCGGVRISAATIAPAAPATLAGRACRARLKLRMFPNRARSASSVSSRSRRHGVVAGTIAKPFVLTARSTSGFRRRSGCGSPGETLVSNSARSRRRSMMISISSSGSTPACRARTSSLHCSGSRETMQRLRRGGFTRSSIVSTPGARVR
jgi:hypothetical protein